jgi:hypothetical protein
MEVGTPLLTAMAEQRAADAHTTFLRYGGTRGFDFLERDDRVKIIDILVLLRRLAEKIGAAGD